MKVPTRIGNYVRMQMNSERVVLFAILCAAAFFRFYRLDQIPPGLNNDEAFNLLDILNLLRGQFSIFFSENTGREPLWFYLNMPLVAFFGPQAFALRLTAAIIGTITVGLVYSTARALFSSRLIASLSAIFTAISIWHVFYSRYGLRIILSVPLTILTLWFFWRGLQELRSRDFVFAGFFAGLGLYTYLSNRLLPIILIVLAIYAMFANRGRTVSYLKGLFITWAVSFLTFLPLGIYFATHLDDFMGHTANLSILDPRVNKGNISLALWNNLVAVLGMFLGQGDREGYRNIPNRPVFDVWLGTLFLLGVIVSLVNLFSQRSAFQSRLRALMLATWIVTFLSSSIISDDAPSFLRTLPALPAAMILAAWGAVEIWRRLDGRIIRRITVGLFSLAVLSSALFGLRDYLAFGESGIAYLSFDAHVMDTANWIGRNASTSRVYLAPLWSRQGTMRVLTRNLTVHSFESRDTVVLPSNASQKDALFVYPWEQERKAEKLLERLGSLGIRENLIGSAGFPIALAIRVPNRNLPDAQNPLPALAQGSGFIRPQNIARAQWSDSFELLGYTIEANDSAKRNLEVSLFLHALNPSRNDYTFSVKVRDGRDRVWGQEDKWAGDNSYPTTVWEAGDVIVEKFYPELNACAPAGTYQLTVEAYNPNTMEVLGIKDSTKSTALLGSTFAEISPSNRVDDLDPEQLLDVQVAPTTRLMGYTLTPQQLEPGNSFSLSLFWRGVGDGKELRRSLITLRDASNRDFAMSDQNIILPAEGRGRCVFFDFTVPPDAAIGAASIFVNGVKIASAPIGK